MYIRLISFGLICRPDVLGHFRASGPAPKPAECFVGGDRARQMPFEARLGEPRKQNGAQRRARGFKCSGAQDNGGDREVRKRSIRDRWIKSQPTRLNGKYAAKLCRRVADQGRGPPRELTWRIRPAAPRLYRNSHQGGRLE